MENNSVWNGDPKTAWFTILETYKTNPMEGYTKIEGKVVRVYRLGPVRSYLVQEEEKKTWYPEEDVMDTGLQLWIKTETYNKKNNLDVK